jgi:hypothetical protein
MPLLSDQNPNTRFCVSAYGSLAEKEAEEGSDSNYATRNEALQEFKRLVKGAQFFQWSLGSGFPTTKAGW